MCMKGFKFQKFKFEKDGHISENVSPKALEHLLNKDSSISDIDLILELNTKLSLNSSKKYSSTYEDTNGKNPF